VEWHGVERFPDLSPDSHSLAFYLDGASQDDADLYVMINSYWEPLSFRVQHGEAHEWRLAIDTGLEEPRDFVDGEGEALLSLTYNVGPRSIAVLLRARRSA
jgi:glycogen operon protein